jgi:hypothetical protein
MARVVVVVVVSALLGVALGASAHWLTAGGADPATEAAGSTDDTDAPETSTTTATTEPPATTAAPSTSSTASTAPPASPGPAEGYTAEIEANFMTECVAAAASTVDPESACQCAYDQIVETVPFDEFIAYDLALRRDPAAEPPEGVVDAIVDCTPVAGGPASPTTTVIS